ncbi:MAG: Txe/YoeB family addiction module toxin [Bacteroidales bacterium]|nr:Txe/YoeB family addiction module toxin [Bacteroidales bacterium]
MFKIVFTKKAKEHYLYFVQMGNEKTLSKIHKLLKDIAEHPYIGIGKPEALKFSLSGKWSRRINREHRIIYSVNEEEIIVHILALRSHYSQ